MHHVSPTTFDSLFIIHPLSSRPNLAGDITRFTATLSRPLSYCTVLWSQRSHGHPTNLARGIVVAKLVIAIWSTAESERGFTSPMKAL